MITPVGTQVQDYGFDPWVIHHSRLSVASHLLYCYNYFLMRAIGLDSEAESQFESSACCNHILERAMTDRLFAISILGRRAFI